MLALAAALALGCATAPSAPPAPAHAALAPATPAQGPPRQGWARVERVRGVGAYLEAELVARAGRSALLFAASATCRGLLQEGAEVRVLPEKPLARIAGHGPGAESCPARGIAQLAAWRDALPDRRASVLVPTAPAELRLLHATGSGELLAAGKLPLALELRWATPLDVVAVLPDTPACRAHLARERTQMEFRPRGDDALVLRGRLDPCPILAIAEPIYLE